MSRPFSYSDENFTVVGNVLFCHIEIKEAVLKKRPIVEIPPEIYAHMLFNTQRLSKVQRVLNVQAFSTVDVGVLASREGANTIYYLFSNEDIYETGAFLVGYYILKDI